MKKLLSFVILIAFTAIFGFSSCGNANGGSDKIEGEWIEYRADSPSDTYLLSHYQFNNNGTGAFWLTDDGEIRQKFEFTWEKDDYGQIITHTFDGDVALSFNNGLIVKNSASGNIVYKKK